MADLTFASWAQTPVAHAIDGTDRAGALGPAVFEPSLELTRPDGTGERVSGPRLTMLGPEGVAGLDPKVVVRTDPPRGAGEVESNYFASVELLPVELPWLFTPAKPDAQGRLRPWIVLVVVETARSTLRPGKPLPLLQVGVDQLQDLDESWGWAHVQRPAPGATPPPGLGALIGQSVARLVCPRRLAPSTRYRACIVPAFRGSGEGHELSWKLDQADEPTLPVLYEWEFATGVEGDFEQLVRRLGPAPPERIAGLGRKLVDVAKPWPADTPLAGVDGPAPLAVPGALVSAAVTPPGVAPETLADAAKRLEGELNTPADRLHGTHDPEATAVAPPIYGGHHVSRERVFAEPPAEPPPDPWLEELNLQMQTRIAAGLGAEYVRANQEPLMARAWQQVGQIREENRRRSLGALASEVAESLHQRHVQNLGVGEAVAMSAPAAWRVRWAGGGPTLATEVDVSTLANRARSPAFLRFMRPGGPVARATGTSAASALERGLAGEVPVPEARPLVDRVDGAPSAQPATELATAATSAVEAGLSEAAAGALVMVQALASTARVNGLADGAATLQARLAALPVDQAAIETGDISTLRASVAPMLGLVDEQLTGVRAELFAAGPPSLAGEQAPDPAITPYGVKVDVDGLHERVVAVLSPREQIARRLAAQATVPAHLGEEVSLEPLMAHPVFPAPMALALVDSAPDWFIPGIADFPADSATLLSVNGRFVESYLVGLSHEFNRELLWREFPTDRRGTSFMNFWPRPDGLADIPEISTWKSGLGEHLTLGEHAIAVLLVRGTVVRRFPGMVVAASKALAAPEGQPPVPDGDPANWQPPLFVIQIDPQTAAYAFALDPDELRAPVSPAAPGWFFAFQEHSYRIRFGFDLADQPLDPNRPFADWNQLDWDRVPTPRGFAEARTAITAPPGITDPEWGRDGADVARIALQRPFRVLIHAHELVRP